MRQFLKYSLPLVLAPVLGAAFAAPASSAEPDPDRYIVSMHDVGKGRAALQSVGARIELELPDQEAVAAHIPPRALEALRRNPNIEYIERDAPRYPMAQTMPWGIPAVQADPAGGGVGFAGNANRKVCIIDSGYAGGHEDLPQGFDITGQASTGWNTDTCFHGTHVAGTIAALGNDKGVVGVMPGGNLKLHIVKVFDGPDCGWSYASTLVSALSECESAGANVISMSLGGTFKSRTEERAFSDAWNRGRLSVAAAGNDGNTRYSYPASYSSVVSVGAVDSSLALASFSQRNDQVELAAPGVGVLSTVGMGSGLASSVAVDSQAYASAPMDGSFVGSASGLLFACAGVGAAGECAGATGRICLIVRGSTSFADKVLECQAEGGLGAVIYNNEAGGFLGTLGGTSTAIPSVSVSDTDGQAMLADAGLFSTVAVETSNYAEYDGTSMATPHVAGVAALVWSLDPTKTNQQIREALTASAVDLGQVGRDTSFGFGMVQAKAAAAFLAGGGGGDDGGGTCTSKPLGDSCTADAECCSGTCKGKPGLKVCK